MRILGLDYGSKTVGVAVSDELMLTAQGLEIVRRQSPNKLRQTLARIEQIVTEYQVERIVLGLPKNMDGTEGERARKSRKLAKTVEIWSGLPVRMWDERQTTCAAADLLDESGTFGAKRKSILDSVSATVILDDYLAWRKEHPGEV